MTVHVAWENEQKQVLLMTFNGSWTLEEFREAVEKSYAMMDTVDYTVNIIVDLQKGNVLPRGFIGSLRRTVKTPHRNHGMMALVGVSAFIRAFYDAFVRIRPSKRPAIMRMAEDYEEAHAIFARSAQSDVAAQSH